MQVEPFAVFIQAQLMKHISGSRSIPDRFESEAIDIYLGFDLQLSFANGQETGPFLEITHFQENTLHGKSGSKCNLLYII